MIGEQLADIACEANLAPSVHNTQPTRWQLDGNEGIILSLDPKRLLAVGDPTGHDARLSGGAALLGTQYALWRRGVGVRAIEYEEDKVRIALGGDPLSAPECKILENRTSYRASFSRPTEQQRDALTRCVVDRNDASLFADASQISTFAALNDTASLSVMKEPDFRSELLHWMRLSKRHRDWDRDGLSAEALAMSTFEAAGAGIVLRKPIFDILSVVGLARAVTSEAARTETSTGIVAFHRPISESRWKSGMAFYDLWLQLTVVGFAVWPMAVLADDAEARSAVSKLADLPDDRTIISVLRVGPHPGALQPEKARLPANELCL